MSLESCKEIFRLISGGRSPRLVSYETYTIATSHLEVGLTLRNLAWQKVAKAPIEPLLWQFNVEWSDFQGWLDAFTLGDDSDTEPTLTWTEREDIRYI